MTRAKDISKIVTDANLSGTLDVTGKVGILGTNDLGVGLHIKEGDSGVTSVSTDADQLVIENNAESGISILAPTNSASRIAFGDSDNNKIGMIYYNHSSNFMMFEVNNSEAMRIDSSGNVAIGHTSTGGSNFAICDGANSQIQFFAEISTDTNLIQHYDPTATAYMNSEHRANSHEFKIGTSNAVKIDSSGNVGIGGTSFNPKLYVVNNSAGPFLTAANATAVFHGSSDIGKGGSIGFDYGASHTNYPVGIGYAIGSQAGNTKGSLVFGTRSETTDIAPTERMRIHDNGFISVGNTSADAMINITNNYPNTGVRTNSNTTVAHWAIEFHNANGRVGTIETSGSSTSYNESSDYRLKENVTADWDATTRLKQLNPVRFNFIADADTTVDGFLAHEVQSVVPHAISGTHNEVDADGNPVYQGIDQSKLVPLLVKTIQELEARITALENGE